MLDFTTDDWEFHLGDEPNKDIKVVSDPMALPYVSSPDAWAQYSNKYVYEADKLVREWISIMSESSTWRTRVNDRRYTFAMIFEQIYGRSWVQKEDAKLVNAFIKVLSYYSSRIQKSGDIKGKYYTKTIYTISPNRIKKPPYSLKLRMEWLLEQNIMPDGRNMQMPKDDLKPGHARNPRTDANMEKRRKEGRRIYEERYGDRKH